MNSIVRPIITEKSIKMAEGQNQYTFEVHGNANKTQAAADLSKMFGVKVLSIQAQNRLGKKVNYGKTRRRETKKNDLKIMVFKLKAGDSIDLFKA